MRIVQVTIKLSNKFKTRKYELAWYHGILQQYFYHHVEYHTILSLHQVKGLNEY